MKRKKRLQVADSFKSRLEFPPVIVVMLRQPHMEKPSEMRSDPFWEYGSFGLTGCHQRNLMHPGKAHLLNGARLAFVQGGKQGSRLVFLTPPVLAIPYADRTEVLWDADKPFRYSEAPIVVTGDGESDMPSIKELISGVNRNGWMGKFASKFRSRREPLPDAIAREMVAVYESMRKSGGEKALATKYEQALPVNPPLIDRKRRTTYRKLLANAKGAA